MAPPGKAEGNRRTAVLRGGGRAGSCWERNEGPFLGVQEGEEEEQEKTALVGGV